MWRPAAIPGTLLNTATVLVGSCIGLLLSRVLGPELQSAALTGIGLVLIPLGAKMFFGVRNVLVVAGAIALGGVVGVLCRISPGIEALSTSLRNMVGGPSNFNEGWITASVLFCVGPMTILGCAEDALQGKSDLLRLKSLLDGIASVFLSATLGIGVLFSALTVLLVQGLITQLGGLMRPLAESEDLMAELTAIGGIFMLAIGLNLAKIKSVPTADYLPALVLGPVFASLANRKRA